jgi:hypothetical protein
LRTKTVAVLSFGDKDLLVVAIAVGAMTSGITGMPREERSAYRAAKPDVRAELAGPARILR